MNPICGKGHGPSVFRKVEIILKEAEIDFEVLRTTGPGHTREFLKTEKNVSRFGGILVMSGKKKISSKLALQEMPLYSIYLLL